MTEAYIMSGKGFASTAISLVIGWLLAGFFPWDLAFPRGVSTVDNFIVTLGITSEDPIVKLVVDLLCDIILPMIGIAILTYFGLLFFGLSGYWSIKHAEEVDGTELVKTWKEASCSDKKKNSDLTAPRLECPLRMPFTEPYLKRFLNDESDIFLLHTLVSATTVLVPMAGLVYLMFIYAPFWLACVYGFGLFQAVRVVYFMDSMLHYRHYASHRPLFRSKVLNFMPSVYLDPLMGVPPVVFLLHHPIMHHIANNGYYDISSTEAFERDSWWDFAKYWLRFQVGAYYELPVYAWKSNHKGWCLAAVTLIGSFFLCLLWLADNVSGWATFCVFGLPWVYDHATDAIRNWCQHMFVVQYDSKAPASSFFDVNCGLSYNLIDSYENRTQYNEGYHVIHHCFAGHHWSKLPDQFYRQVETLSTYDEDVWCLTFQRTTIWEVWQHVVCGKLPQLVKNHFIHIPTKARPNPPTIDEVVTELKARVHKVDPAMRKAADEMAQRRHAFQRQKSYE